MAKAYEVMTHSLATCSPDDKATRVAAMMRDRDIGNVLVVEGGKLCGIVTDRDLTVQALTGSEDPLEAPVKKFMTSRMVTGEPFWSLNRVARTMAKHKIRRLPILDEGQLAGIISLGDLARHNGQKGVTKSLKEISTPANGDGSNRSGFLFPLIGLSLAALSSTMIAWLTWTQNGQSYRKQLAQTRLYHTAQDSIGAARDKIDEIASSKTSQNIRKQVQSNIKEISAQMPTIEYKPPKHKFAWFR